MRSRVLLLVLLLAIMSAGTVNAQSPSTPFTLMGADAVQPSGADEIGDVEADPDEPAILMVNRLDLHYGQLVLTGDDPIMVATTTGDQIEIPAQHLAFIVQVGGDLSAVGPALEFVLMIDSQAGGLGSDALPEFTTDYELFFQIDANRKSGLREFDGEAGFDLLARTSDVTGGLLSVLLQADGRDITLMSDGIWVMVPLDLLGSDTLRLRFETRRFIPVDDDFTAVVADRWPDAGWFTYSPSAGWSAETVNVLEGLDARVSCEITAIGVVNVRNRPSLNGMRVRQIQPTDTATVVSQAVGADGFVWWRLRDGNWVRSDVVRAEASCRDMPRIEP